MSDLLNTYAAQAGVIPADKPNINTQIYPVPFEKYITLHAGDGKISAKHFDYWAEVVGLLKPALHHFNIKIVQVGGPQDQVIASADAHYLNLTYAQSAYVQKGAILHLGIDSLLLHVASAFGKKIVALYGHIYSQQSPCNWSNPEDVIYLEPDRGEKHPPFGPQEFPKMVNTVKVEEICKSVFRLLGLPVDVYFQTKFIGAFYNLPVVEIVPDFFGESEELKSSTLDLRLDLHFDEQCAYAWTQHYACHIVSDKPVNLELLGAGKKNIRSLTLLVDNVDSYSLEYLKAAKKIIPALSLIGTNLETLSDVREKFFDWIIERRPDIDRNKVDGLPVGCKFWSKRILFSKAQKYASVAHWKVRKAFDNENFVINSEDFAKDIEHFFIYQ